MKSVRASFAYPELEPVRVEACLPSWENGPFLKEEEFARTIGLALHDYLRKSRSNGFVVSLSGGEIKRYFGGIPNHRRTGSTRSRK